MHSVRVPTNVPPGYPVKTLLFEGIKRSFRLADWRGLITLMEITHNCFADFTQFAIPLICHDLGSGLCHDYGNHKSSLLRTELLTHHFGCYTGVLINLVIEFHNHDNPCLQYLCGQSEIIIAVEYKETKKVYQIVDYT